MAVDVVQRESNKIKRYASAFSNILIWRIWWFVWICCWFQEKIEEKKSRERERIEWEMGEKNKIK